MLAALFTSRRVHFAEGNLRAACGSRAYVQGFHRVASGELEIPGGALCAKCMEKLDLTHTAGEALRGAKEGG